MEVFSSLFSAIVGLFQTFTAFFTGNSKEKRISLQREIKSIKNKTNKVISPELYMFSNTSIKFVGRENEIKLLQEFVDDEKCVSWWAITGEAGKGKSRLAYEFIQSLDHKKWIAKFIDTNEMKRIYDIPNESFSSIRKNLFLVLDYLYMQETEIARFIEKLSYLNVQKTKIRILLIEREYKRIDKNGETLVAPWIPFFQHGFSSDNVRNALAYKMDSNLSLNNVNLTRDDAYSIVKDFFKSKKITALDSEINYIIDFSERIRNKEISPLILLIVSENYLKHKNKIRDKFSNNALLSDITADSFSSMKKFMTNFDLKTESALREFVLISILLPSLSLGEYPKLSYIFGQEPEYYKEISGLIAKTPICYNDEMSKKIYVCTLKPDLIGEQFVFSYVSTTDPKQVRAIFNEFEKLYKTELAIFLLRFCNDYDEDLAEIGLRVYFNTLIPNDEIKNITIKNDQGMSVDCEVLFTFESETTHKNYIVYSDGSVDGKGNVQVYASIYFPNETGMKLLPLEIEEYKIIQEVLDEIRAEAKINGIEYGEQAQDYTQQYKLENIIKAKEQKSSKG